MANANPDKQGLKPKFSKVNQPKKRGRKPGIPNRNHMIRDIIEKYCNGGIEGYVKNLLSLIEQIEDIPKRVEAFTKLMPYFAPQLKAVDATLSMDDTSGQITIVYNTINKPTKPDIEIK